MLDNLLLFVALPLSFIAFCYGAFILFRKYSRKKWCTITATITSISEESEELALSVYNTITYYYPNVTYRYTFNGITYNASSMPYKTALRVAEVNKFGDPTPEKDFFWHSWSVGDDIQISLNPNKPELSRIS